MFFIFLTRSTECKQVCFESKLRSAATIPSGACCYFVLHRIGHSAIKKIYPGVFS
jgi:hypothetical protein